MSHRPADEAAIRQELTKDLELQADMEDEILRHQRPGLFYDPPMPSPERPYAGHKLFHQSAHPVRVLVPGNGWLKTCAMAHEANAWATHFNLWQRTPSWPVSMIWFGPGLSQWRKIRKELFEPFCFDRSVGYRIQEASYRWPDGSTLEFRSYEAGWSVEQGTNPDIVFFDELPPWDLFREIEMRRRGKRKTRMVIAATQTMGTSWLEDVLYKRWLAFHVEQGIDEEGAMLAQKHPYIWCWPKGGIRDNPYMTAEDFHHYEENIVYSSDAERKVRLSGGFGDWSGASVFDLAGVRYLQSLAKAAMANHEYISLNASIIPYEEAA